MLVTNSAWEVIYKLRFLYYNAMCNLLRKAQNRKRNLGGRRDIYALGTDDEYRSS